MESIELPVRLIDDTTRAHLSLEGTVLIFSQCRGREESEVQIPVELLDVSEASRFKASRLIAALLALLVPLLAVGLFGVVSGAFDEDSEPNVGVALASILLVLCGFVAFCILLTSFFFRVKTVRFTVAPSGKAIEFWRSKKDSTTIDELLRQIDERQKLVDELCVAPGKGAIAFADEPSLGRQFVAYTFISVIPAMILRRPVLLLLALAPVVWLLYRITQRRRHPIEFRQALRCYRAKDWDGAAEQLVGLLDRQPEYLPAYFLLLTVFTRSARFDDALDIAARLQADWPQVAQDLQTDIWRIRRMAERRKGQGLCGDP